MENEVALKDFLELQMDDITRKYFDDKFGEVNKHIHILSERTTRLEIRMEGGVVTPAVCKLVEAKTLDRISLIESSQRTIDRRLWAAILAAVTALGGMAIAFFK